MHPLISLLDFDKVRITAEMLADTFAMDFYNITYNESAGCRMRYGQTTYDFQAGGMFFSSPGQPLTGIQVAETKLAGEAVVKSRILIKNASERLQIADAYLIRWKEGKCKN